MSSSLLFVAALIPLATSPGEPGANGVLHVPDHYETIGAAIDAASDGDVVLVQPGIYTETLDFQGKAITVTGTRPADRAVVRSTVVDAKGAGTTVSFLSGEPPEAELTGLTITGGLADWGGGGLLCMNGSSPTVSYCLIKKNEVIGSWETYGGGIHCDASHPSFAHCVIKANYATHGGGFFARYSARPEFEYCDIVENNSLHGSGGFMGQQSNASFRYCNVTDNTATEGGGGGLQIRDSHATVEHCIIARNQAGLNGGGIWCYNSSPTIDYCTIVDNLAPWNGGAIYCEAIANPVVTNSILVGNGPEEIYIVSGEPAIEFCDVLGGWPGTGNIDANPEFMSDFKLPYILAHDSPCIDAANPADEDGVDWAELSPRYSRYNSVAADMGAYGGPGNVGWLKVLP
ncbi:MAG: hypothetical protein CME06_14160 [Gemmatimonadetes bacterium]|nr:hypothetical protein [Gemmatimonadota bacterium]